MKGMLPDRVHILGQGGNICTTLAISCQLLHKRNIGCGRNWWN